MTQPPSATPPKTASKWRGGLHLSIHLYLAFGVALLTSMLVASYMQASSGLDAMRQYGDTARHANHLERLHQLLIDAQAEVRGYALTRDPRYLNALGETLPLIHEARLTIEQDLEPETRIDALPLVERAQDVVARLQLTVRHLEAGEAPQNNWFDEDTDAMNAYRRQHEQIRAALFSKNLQSVSKSVNEFDNARISTVLLAVASLLLLVLAVSQKQKKQELEERIRTMLEADNARLEREVQLRTLELTNLATYLTEVREREKLHLAREMHDELGALLTAAKLDADWIERKLSADARAAVAPRMARLRHHLVGGITLKRRITNGLRPALLYDLGLIEALKALVEEFRQSGEVDLKVDLPEAEPDLGDALALSLFRIVQEAFTNILKYAQARHARLSLHQVGKAIELSIEDDGVGFDPDCPRVARHGLAGIKHRVFTHGGRLDIRTSPGAGVAIRAVLPN